MMKQILTTSALIAIAAVSIQSASAADTTKFRQLVVEPSGTPAAVADTGNADAHKRKRLLLAPSESIPTTPGVEQTAQFVVAPSQGLETPADVGGEGKPKQAFPALAKTSDGIATPVKFAEADRNPGETAGNKTFPLIATAPQGLSIPADVTADTGESAAADVTPVAPITATDGGRLATDAAPATPVIASVAPAAPAASPTLVVANPKDLYTLLTGRGYGVQILKRGAHGNPVIYVTIPGKAGEGDLLLVDSTYGKVIKRQHVAAHGYEHPAPYTPRYAATHAGEDNCDQTAGY